MQEVKEGFGNQITLCRDRGLNPGPPAQMSDTLPQDSQVTLHPNCFQLQLHNFGSEGLARDPLTRLSSLTLGEGEHSEILDISEEELLFDSVIGLVEDVLMGRAIQLVVRGPHLARQAPQIGPRIEKSNYCLTGDASNGSGGVDRCLTMNGQRGGHRDLYSLISGGGIRKPSVTWSLASHTLCVYKGVRAYPPATCVPHSRPGISPSSIEVIEKHIETSLKTKMAGFSMERFIRLLEDRRDGLEGEVFEMLFTFSDFIAFKEMFLDYRAMKEGTAVDFSSGIQITHLTS
uniref:ADP-ribosylation factor-like protein 2-binding protein n=1 Tax=Timema monikensis TaxID=170555 RepID=A0A7R9HP16_9NEOP|nr:unnamed protein product [Timema monikensis]